MDNNKFEVIFYQQENGEIPVANFISSLGVKMGAKTLRTIELLENNGNELRMPHSKALEDNLFELRMKFGSDISRIFYFFYLGKKIILTNGFIKKTQKTPKLEKELAKKYRADFFKKQSEEKR